MSKLIEMWDSTVPDLVEEFFPKGQCKERGKAIVLVAMIYIKLLPKIKTLYKIDETKLAKLLYKNICHIFGYRIVTMGENIKNIDEKYYKLAKLIIKHTDKI